VADPLRVVVADDQQLLRTGFRVILESEPDIVVVGEAADGLAAVEAARRSRPDVVLMDIRMPVLDGLAATERLMTFPDPPRVVVLTTFDQNEYVVRALRAGAYGFLLKDAPASRLVTAIRAAASGEALIEPAITRRMVELFTVPVARPTGLPPALRYLTAREVEVLRLVARGLSNAEIAEELVVADSTVKTHVGRLLTKLGLRDRVQAVVMAYESGLVSPGQAPAGEPS
jgi:DNA-binding NarL/FixJ family response regulator